MKYLIRWGELIFLIPLSLMVILRVAPQLGEHPHLVLFLIGELTAVALLLLQRRGDWAIEPFPIAVAFLGSCLALLVAPQGIRLVPDSVSLALIVGGATVSLAAKLFLGRSFGIVPANRGVKETGVYRLIRHPMYAGYMLNHLGFLLVFFSGFNAAIYAAAWTALWLRAVEEEKFLGRDPTYRAYAEKVRYRLIPGIA